MPQEQKSIPQVVSELWEMLISYAKQETVEPLKGLARFVGIGAAAMVMVGVGVVLLSVSVLRLLQTKEVFSWSLTGNLSVIPYVVSLVVLGVLILLAVAAIKPNKPNKPKRSKA